jgi:hypothetical protein
MFRIYPQVVVKLQIEAVLVVNGESGEDGGGER